MKKRLTIFLILTLLAVSFSVSNTLSLLSSQDMDKNTLTVGKVSITLDETDVDEFGNVIEGASRVKENNYHLMPGYTYIKDPTVTIKKGSLESYIRIILTINKTKELKEIFGEDYKLEKYINGWNKEKWPCAKITETENNTTIYEFRYYKESYEISSFSKNGDVVLEPLFESFYISEKINGEQLKKISDLEIKVIAHAIQSKGFENENEAWESFETENE